MLTGLRLSIRDETSGEVRARAFSRLPVRIGRNPLNDLQLEEAFISQFHAVLEVDESGHLALRDLGSRNGTMIGGQRVPPNARLGFGGAEATFSVLNLTFEARLAEVSDDRGRTAGGTPKRSGRALAATMLGDASLLKAARPPAATKIEAQALDARVALDLLADTLMNELPKMQQDLRDVVILDLRNGFPEVFESTKTKTFLASIGVFDIGGKRGVVEAVRALAANYVRPDALPVSDDDLRRFLERLQVVLDVFLKTFIPLRDGYRKFESGLNLQRTIGRTLALDSQRESVSSARDAATLAQVLFDPRDESEAAPRQVEETYADLMIHHVALLGGVMRGVKALLKELSPPEIERTLDENKQKTDVGASWGWFRWRALYRIFSTRHSDYADEEKKTFSKVFGNEFSEAYGRFLESDRTT